VNLLVAGSKLLATLLTINSALISIPMSSSSSKRSFFKPPVDSSALPNPNLQFPNIKLQTSNSKVHTPNSRLQTSNFQTSKLQTSNFQVLQTSDFNFKLQTANFRLQTVNIKLDFKTFV
jgi:hypothetical protein